MSNLFKKEQLIGVNKGCIKATENLIKQYKQNIKKYPAGKDGYNSLIKSCREYIKQLKRRLNNMYEQLSIPGIEQPKPKKKREPHVLELYYNGHWVGTKTVMAYSRKQAIYLFYNENKYNRQYEIGNR